MNRPPSRDLAQTTLAVFFIGLLTATCFWILRPFLPALIWATMIVVATWPLMRAVQDRVGGKRALAVAIMTAAMLLIFIVPVSLAIGTIVDNADKIAAWVKSLATFTMPPPPEWMARVPLVGPRLTHIWQQVAMAAPEELAVRLTPYMNKVIRWFVAQAGSFGVMFVHFLLTVIISAILYAKGEGAAEGIRRFAGRIAGVRGENAVLLAGQAIRAVALGVIVTAMVQSILAGIGLAVAGLPLAALLTAVVFILAIAQIGPAPVLLPAVIWLYWKDSPGWGTALLIWSLLVGSLDNVLRPILIRRGADLSLLLIFSGVIGGLLAFGVIGLFVGPVVLAVTYTLVVAWVQDENLERAPSVGIQEPGRESIGGPT
jgi:predicted PurR-regulated permease PerM